MSNRKFVIAYVDPLTHCIEREVTFETSDVRGLISIIDPEGDSIPEKEVYDLQLKDLEKISARFGISLDPHAGSCIVHLRSWHPYDELSYKLHTNRELILMLNGEKPLTVFSDEIQDPEREIIPEKAFEPYVHSGLFLKREHIDRKVRRVFYVKPSEAWRVDAYLLLWRTAEKTGWNAGFEYMEGLLLGYQEWQCDLYLEKIKKWRLKTS